MDTNKIADLFALVEKTLKTIKDETTGENEKMMLGWKILSNLTQVFGLVNSTNVRAPGQVMVGQLILKESNRFIDETVKSIENIPDEFKMMINSIKLTGQENDIEKTDRA